MSKKEKYFLIGGDVLEKIAALSELARAWADYYIADEPIENEETDAQRLVRILPIIERYLKERKKSVDYSKLKQSGPFDGVLYLAERKARESVNPNYKYCVVDCDLQKCWLTDDLSKAMNKAHTMAICTHTIFYVLEIFKANDGTYKTKFECRFYDSGKYIEGEKDVFLHFNFIAEKVGEDLYKLE